MKQVSLKPAIVADKDAADGFRLAGAIVFELEECKIPEIIAQIRALKDIGIVLVDERYVESFEQGLADLVLPMVASFPSEHVKREETYLNELVKKFLGQKIYVGGEKT